MKVYSKYNFDFNKYVVGDYIYAGADGEVFKSSDKIIKFVEIFDSKKNANLAWNKIKRNIEWVMDNNPSNFVRVEDFGLVQVFEDNYSIVYFYLMEKLSDISSDENKLFKNIFKDPKAKNLNFCEKDLDSYKYFKFDKEKVSNFVLQTKKCKMKHEDIHVKNIMKDDYGNFKFIDLERMTYDGKY